MTAMENKEIAFPEKVFIFFDRDVPASTFEMAELQNQLARFAQKHKIRFSNAAGIAYNVLLERYLSPGEIVLSTGSHVSIAGAKEAWGLYLDVSGFADALEKGYIDVHVPDTIKISLENTLEKEAEIKDFTLKLLKDFGENGLDNMSIEFYGSGLTEAQRTVLCSMAGQTGAAAVFYSSQDQADAPARTYDLSKIRPMVAHSGNLFDIDLLTSVEGKPINAAFIGSCTGGTIEDLRIAADILKDEQVHLHVRLNICPQTAETYIQTMKEGLIDIFIDCGAQILTPSCGSCQRSTVGGISRGEVMLTTGAYNYRGCCGPKDSEVYMASVAAVAQSAITGKITCVSEKEVHNGQH